MGRSDGPTSQRSSGINYYCVSCSARGVVNGPRGLLESRKLQPFTSHAVLGGIKMARFNFDLDESVGKTGLRELHLSLEHQEDEDINEGFVLLASKLQTPKRGKRLTVLLPGFNF